VPDHRPRQIVVGGGIAGLLCALLLSERKGLDVTLVERAPSVGGLLGRLDYDGAGTFDLGMHNMYETGIAGLDGLLHGLLPADDWQILEGNRRDLAGSWFDGRLQVNCWRPLPRLRRLSTEQSTSRCGSSVHRSPTTSSGQSSSLSSAPIHGCCIARRFG